MTPAGTVELVVGGQQGALSRTAMHSACRAVCGWIACMFEGRQPVGWCCWLEGWGLIMLCCACCGHGQVVMKPGKKETAGKTETACQTTVAAS